MNSLEFDQQQAKLPSKSRGPARIKSQRGQSSEISQKITPQIGEFTFYCIFILQFLKVRGVSWPRWPRARGVPVQEQELNAEQIIH